MNRPGAPQNMIPIRSDDGRQSWMRQLGEEEYEEAFNLIELSAKAGDNIGIGEIPTLDYFRTMMQKSVAVGLYNDNKVLEDLIVLKPYHVVRHVNPVLCQIILATRQRPTEDHLRHLIRLGCGLARREDCGGFTKFVLEIFAYCLPYIRASSLEGFHATCVIPYAGLLAGHKGYTMSYIMYREIEAATSKADQIYKLPPNLHLRRSLQISQSDIKPILNTIPDHLPIEYTCASGLEVRVRHLRLDELPNFYSTFSSAVDQGYGVDEIPTYEIFLQNRVNQFYNFVVEVNGTQEVVAYFNAGPSRSTRCQTQNILAASNLIILPEHRSKRLGKDMLHLGALLSGICGYEHLVVTLSITNLPIVRGSVHEFNHFVGCLPKAVYMSKSGWTDLLITHAKLLPKVDSGSASSPSKAKL